MKLLFDENLSRRLVDLLASEFPGSSHPDLTELRASLPRIRSFDQSTEAGLLVIDLSTSG